MTYIIIACAIGGFILLVIIIVFLCIWCKRRNEEKADLKAYKAKEAERKAEAEKREKEGHVNPNDIEINYETKKEPTVFEFQPYVDQKEGNEVDLSQKSDRKSNGMSPSKQNSPQNDLKQE